MSYMNNLAVEKMNEERDIDGVVEELYRAYGSGTGVLFGISPDLKYAVRAIVKAVMNMK